MLLWVDISLPFVVSYRYGKENEHGYSNEI